MLLILHLIEKLWEESEALLNELNIQFTCPETVVVCEKRGHIIVLSWDLLWEEPACVRLHKWTLKAEKWFCEVGGGMEENK